MSLTNRDIADIFDNIADMLQLKGENIHRYLSYRNAAESIRELPRDLRTIAIEDKLTEIPKIGKTLAAKITEMLETDQLEFYEKLKQEVPVGVVEMMRINGVGPKKAKLFWDELNITDIVALEKAARANKLRGLSGMGAKSEQKIIEGIESLARQTGRALLGDALPQAQTILDTLMQLPQCLKGEIAGSIRRGRATIGDVDLLIAVENMDKAPEIMQTFVDQENVARILGQGETKSSVELLSGLQVDLRVLTQDKWGTALNYFTGSQNHNIRMRELALAKGYSLNEHAFSPVDENKNIIEDAEKITCETEEQVYEFVGLQWVPPELREDSGEFERAKDNTLPDLITLDAIQSDLHMHTTWSDGKFSVLEMAEAAQAKGYTHIVITDHSRSLGIANGLSIERLLAQADEVKEANTQIGEGFTILHGTEMDINADGSLDYPDDVLAQLDFVIASLHVSLRQDRKQITERLFNALHNPHVDMIGHMSARLLPDREPVDLDFDAVLTAAKETDTILEINANPRRLDIEPRYARLAIENGVKIAINTDAHNIEQLEYMPYGIKTARRGWVQKSDVVNTWSTAQLLEWLGNRG